MKKILTIALPLILFFLGGTVSQAQAEECVISDIYFEKPASDDQLTGDSEITLVITPGNSVCSEETTPFNVMITEYDSAIDDDIHDANYLFDGSGDPFKLTFKTNYNECDDDSLCKYFVEVQFITAFYSSDFGNDTTTDFFDTDQKLAAARIEIPREDEQTIGEFNLINVEGELSGCEVTELKLSPYGLQTNPNFLNPDSQGILNLHVETDNCAGENVRVIINDMNGSLDEAAESATTSGIVPDNGTFEVNYKPGDEDCDGTRNNLGYCNYGVEINYGPLGVFNIFYSPDGDVDDPELDEFYKKSKIGFYCVGECDAGNDKEWTVLNTSFANEEGEPTVVTINTDFDETSPCFDTSTGEYKENCYEPLAPLPTGGDSSIFQTDPDTGRQFIDISTFQVGDYVNQIFKIGLGILIVIAIVMIIIGGVEYMAVESIYGKSNARSRITNAVTGLLVALGIFLILSTINPKLLDVNFSTPEVSISYSDIPPVKQSDGTFKRSSGETILVEGEVIVDGTPWPPEDSNLEDIRPELTAMGIEVNKDECPEVGSSNCTSTYFESNTASYLLNKLEDLKEACSDCTITLTGGAEVWLHESHRTNQPIVDLRSESALNQAISGESAFVGGCQKNKHVGGLGITLSIAEDGSCPWHPAPHWHIKF